MSSIATDRESDLTLFLRNTRYLAGVASLSTAKYYRVIGLFDRSSWEGGSAEALSFETIRPDLRRFWRMPKSLERYA